MAGTADSGGTRGHVFIVNLGSVVFGGPTESDVIQHRRVLARQAEEGRWPDSADVLVLGLEVSAVPGDLNGSPFFLEQCERVAPVCSVRVGVTGDPLGSCELRGYVVMVALCSRGCDTPLSALVSDLVCGFATQGVLTRVVFLLDEGLRWRLADFALTTWRAWLASARVVHSEPFVHLLAELLDTPGARAPRFREKLLGLGVLVSLPFLRLGFGWAFL